MLLLDTDVSIDILRGHAPALSWLQALGASPLGMPGLVIMELLQGCQSKGEQQRVERFFGSYGLYWPGTTDCQHALADFATYHLSHNLGFSDSLVRPTSICSHNYVENI